MLPHPPQPPQPHGFPVSTFPMTLASVVLPVADENSSESLGLGGQSNQAKTSTFKPIRPIPIHPIPIHPVFPPSSKMAKLNLNKKTKSTTVDPLPLSLNINTTPSNDQSPNPTTTHASAFQSMSNGDSIISVA